MTTNTVIKNFTKLVLLSVCIVATGCTSTEMLVDIEHHNGGAVIEPYNTQTFKNSIHIFDPIDINSEIKFKQLQQRADNLIIIVDQSASMNEPYRGVSRKTYALEILRRFNKSLPSVTLNGGIFEYSDGVDRILFGASISEWQTEVPLFEPVKFSKELKELDNFRNIKGNSLPVAIDILSEIIAVLKGPTAIILLTRWENIETEVEEAFLRLRQKTKYSSGETIYERYIPDWENNLNDGICVYAIGIGNQFSRALVDQVDTCGFSITADKIAQPRDMSHFVKRVLFGSPKDSDGDGIFDYLDKCPNTKQGRLVNYDGCLLFGSTHSNSTVKHALGGQK